MNREQKCQHNEPKFSCKRCREDRAPRKGSEEKYEARKNDPYEVDEWD